MTGKEYFSKPETVIETQLMMLKKYRNDCLYTFTYAAAEVEAFGSEVIFYNDGPPNAGEPIIRKPEQINNLSVPEIEKCKSLMNVLEITEALKNRVGDTVPIIGVVMSPFSLPVMQLALKNTLNCFISSEQFDKLMNITRNSVLNGLTHSLKQVQQQYVILILCISDNYRT
jgi:uroporphyrinogen decarboxylase